MRGALRHVLVGSVLTSVATVAVAVGLSTSPSSAPAAQADLAAAPVVTIANQSAVASVDRYRPTSRTQARPALSSPSVAVERRSTSLAKQGKSIKAEQKAIKRQRAAAAAKRKRLIAKLGYQPGTTDPRSIARQIMTNKYGYGADQFNCFNNIIIRESNWIVNATNPSSGAYGIPQSLPGSKMASVGADWRTNPATQITWAIKYMQDVYGSPCGAWGFKSANGWY
jgi:hypothetical protein